MKSGRILLFLLLSLFFLISACQDEKTSEKKNDYSGVSNLIADRNKARYEVAENPPARKSGAQKVVSEKTPAKSSREEELATAILYEQKIDVVGSESGRVIASGVAYINKKGQIVRIKITKE